MYAVFILIGLGIVGFFLQSTIPGFTESFALIASDVTSRPWTLISAIFLHGDVAHLLYNMFALGLFGIILESIIGKKRFLTLFFGAGLLASIGSVFFYDAAVGASGAIFGVLGTLAVLRPRMQVWVSYVPMPMYIAAAVWALGDIVGFFVPDGIANFAHLIGLAIGLLVGVYYRKDFGEKVQKREAWQIDDDDLERWERKFLK